MAGESFSVPTVARRLGVGEDKVRKVCDRLGVVQRIGRARCIPESMVKKIAAEIGVEMERAPMAPDMIRLRVGVRGDGKVIVASVPTCTNAYDIERLKTAFTSGDVPNSLEILADLEGQLSFVDPAHVRKVQD